MSKSTTMRIGDNGIHARARIVFGALYEAKRERVLEILIPYLVLGCLVFVPLSCCSDPSRPCPERQVFEKVTRVLDGDTVLLASGDKVRYIGVDAPDKGECFEKEATRFHRELVAGKTVRLELDVRLVDPYGRLLAYVYLDTLFVNAALVSAGCCRASAYTPNTEHRNLLEALEAEARDEKRGMWGQCDLTESTLEK